VTKQETKLMEIRCNTSHTLQKISAIATKGLYRLQKLSPLDSLEAFAAVQKKPLWSQRTRNKITRLPILTSAIFLSKNPILNSRSKYIEIKHHFIKDYVQKGNY
jgi:hypothetical protein